MVGEDNAFRHLLEGRVDVVEIPRVIDVVAVCLKRTNRQLVARLHMCRHLRRAEGLFRCPVIDDIDDRKTVHCLFQRLNVVFLRTRLCPLRRTLCFSGYIFLRRLPACGVLLMRRLLSAEADGACFPGVFSRDFASLSTRASTFAAFAWAAASSFGSFWISVASSGAA